MSEPRPRRAAVTKRQPTNTLLANVTRRTPAEVKQAKSDAIAAATEAERQMVATKVQKKNQIADQEDRLRKEDLAREKIAMRPDLQSASAQTKV